MNFQLIAFRIPKEYIDKLKKIKMDSHVGVSEQVRTALRDYFKKMDKLK